MTSTLLVLAHEGPRQLHRLIDAAGPAFDEVIVHVDKRVDIAAFRHQADGRATPARFLEHRLATSWGSFTTVEADLLLVRAALDRGSDRIVLVSGSDFPLAPPQVVADFMASHSGAQLINLVRVPDARVGKRLDRFNRYSLTPPGTSRRSRQIKIKADAILRRIPLDRFDYPRGLGGRDPYAGSSWWSLTGDAAAFLLSETEANPGLVRFFRRAVLPDESFVHTVLGNSPFAANIQRSVSSASKFGGFGPMLVTLRDHLAGRPA